MVVAARMATLLVVILLAMLVLALALGIISVVV